MSHLRAKPGRGSIILGGNDEISDSIHWCEEFKADEEQQPANMLQRLTTAMTTVSARACHSVTGEIER